MNSGVRDGLYVIEFEDSQYFMMKSNEMFLLYSARSGQYLFDASRDVEILKKSKIICEVRN